MKTETDIEKLFLSLHQLERNVLPFLKYSSITTIVEKSNLEEVDVMKGLQLLDARGLVTLQKSEEEVIELDSFGLRFLKEELPEIQMLNQLGSSSSKKLSSFTLESEVIGAALGELKKKKLIETQKTDELEVSPTSLSKEFLKQYANPLKLFETPVRESALTDKQKKVLDEFKFRKGFFKKAKIKAFSVQINADIENLLNEFEKFRNVEIIDSIETSMLKDGSWRNKKFRRYDVNVNTVLEDIGREHPMLESNKILSDIFVEMGFHEMTGPIVESEFWCFDCMWIPQDHPAREDHDTFFLDGKAKLPDKYLDSVREMHERGIKKTHTTKGEWSEQISQRRVLRTHSTSTSFRYLADLGERYKKGENINGKYFYLAPVFRNEAVDATHLPEFYQGEGFIIGDKLSLADLMGFIKQYYLKLGIEKIRFKPTYNPYTEPSMEAHYYDPKLKKWYALINSGIFRPETLKPFGLENKTIIAWGIGASRVAALLTGAQSMRDITGVTCDFTWLKKRPVLKREVARK